MKEVLAINPVIHDFSAYDLWLKPYGFLHIISVLRKNNIRVKLIDCLDRFHPELKNYPDTPLKTDQYGCGKFYECKVKKPEKLKFIPRYYRRYGLPKEIITNELKKARPDLILMTSGMTYWYPGIKELIEILKNSFPDVPVILGGTYVSLCPQHAHTTGADFIIENNKIDEFCKLIAGFLNVEITPQDIYTSSPDYSLYSHLPYIVIRTSWGCVFNCTYCGIKFIHPEYREREIDTVIEEIKFYFRKGVKNFAFYDDALLYNTGRIKYFLKKLIAENIIANFHTPNGLHARFIDEELAKLMHKARFINPRLSLESADDAFQHKSGGKVFNSDFEKAIYNLTKAGYKEWEYSAYLLIGLPEEDLEMVRTSIQYAKKLKARPLLAEYAPIPGTEIAKKIKYNLSEPLYHNNSIFPAYTVKEWKQLQVLKDLARKITV